MKKFTTLLFSAVAACALASCGNTPAPAPTWKAEDVTLMKEHLYGEVLPFYKEGLTVAYSSGDDSVKFTTTTLQTNLQDLTAYAANYSTEKGWTPVQYSGVLETFFAFEKEVEDEGDSRFVEVQFFPVSGTSQALEGNFYMVARDPYVYEWSNVTTTVSEFVEELTASTIALPAFNDEDVLRYYVYPGDTYEMEFPYVLVDLNSNSELDYKASVEADPNWNLEATPEDDGYYTAYSKDGTYSFEFKQTGTYIAIYLSNSVKSWPAEAISNALGCDEDVLPELTGTTEILFTVQGLTIYSDAENVISDYESLLENTSGFINAGKDSYGDNVFYSPHHEFMVQIYEDTDSTGETVYALVFLAVNEWDNETIATNLAVINTTWVLPAISSTQYDEDYAEYPEATSTDTSYEFYISTSSYDYSVFDMKYYAAQLEALSWTKTKDEALTEEYEGETYEIGHEFVLVDPTSTYQVDILVEDYYFVTYTTFTVSAYTPETTQEEI